MTKFKTSDPYTLGVEEEFQILDPETGDLKEVVRDPVARRRV